MHGSSSASGSLSAIASLLLLEGRRDVVIEPEEVLRVVAALDLDEPLEGRARVGLADARLALLVEEAYVRAAVALAQRRREAWAWSRPGEGSTFTIRISRRISPTGT
jgi:hypothetical protein